MTDDQIQRAGIYFLATVALIALLLLPFGPLPWSPMGQANQPDPDPQPTITWVDPTVRSV